MAHLFSSADLALAQRIEQGHVASGAAFAKAHQQKHPDSLSAVEPIAGGWAIFQGVGLPSTQALGVGMDGPVSPAELDRLEAFFHHRGSPAVLDICTLAHQSVLTHVQERGYAVREITNVLARRLSPEEAFPLAPSHVEMHAVAPGDIEEWGRLVMRGFLEKEEVSEEFVAMVSLAPSHQHSFFGLGPEGRLSGAAMNIHEGLATLYGDATLIHGRGRGFQLALIRHRLQKAAELGCDLASASVWPGTSSHRNYERAGFQLVYARVMVSREPSIHTPKLTSL